MSKCVDCGILEAEPEDELCYKCLDMTNINIVASNGELKKQLDRLLSVVNAVTCPHRHGQPIRPRDLTRLCNRQIEVEEALREMEGK